MPAALRMPPEAMCQEPPTPVPDAMIEPFGLSFTALR
jgi:hypothetical protein